MVNFTCFDNVSKYVQNLRVGHQDVWSVCQGVPHFTNALIYVLSEIRKLRRGQKSTLCVTAILGTNENMVIMSFFLWVCLEKIQIKKKSYFFLQLKICDELVVPS